MLGYFWSRYEKFEKSSDPQEVSLHAPGYLYLVVF